MSSFTDIDRSVSSAATLVSSEVDEKTRQAAIKTVMQHNDVQGSATILQALGLIPYNGGERVKPPQKRRYMRRSQMQEDG